MCRKKSYILLLVCICDLFSSTVNGGVLENNLVGYYPLDGSFLNVVGNVATAPNGGINFIYDPNRGTVANLNGTNATSSPIFNSWTKGTFIDLSNIINLSNIKHGFTISFWAKSSPLDKSTQGIVEMLSGYNTYLASGGSGAVPKIELYAYHNLFADYRYILCQGSISRHYIWSTLFPNTADWSKWHHYVIEKNPNVELKLFIDNIYRGAVGVNLGDMGSVDHIRIGSVNKESFKGLIDDIAIWDALLSPEEIQNIYYNGIPNPKTAANPNPANGAIDVNATVTLSWSGGQGVVYHDIYLGTNQTSVRDATTASAEYAGRQGDTNYLKSGLDYKTTYYWRIDEVIGGDVWRGNVWSFTTKKNPALAYQPSPENSGPCLMAANLKWKAGLGAITHDIYVGTNMAAVTNAARITGDIDGDGGVGFSDISIFANQWLTHPTGMTPSSDVSKDGFVNLVDFAVISKNWGESIARIGGDIDGDGKVGYADVSLLASQWLMVPAGKPSADVYKDGYVNLSDFAVIAKNWTKTFCSIFKGNYSNCNYQPSTLAMNTTYYWRVDEVNGSNILKGDVWSFTTQALAFPGAQGAGKWALGGRWGQVIEVTNLNDSGPGSFRAACEANGPRIVVFRVSGNIALTSIISILHPYITIAGQTAPGGGVCIKDFDVEVHADHVIIRHMRFRPADNYGVETRALEIQQGKNIMIDHCSASWAVDQTLDVYCYPSTIQLDKVTLQWCMITEGFRFSCHHSTVYPPDGPPYNGMGMGTLIQGGNGAQYTMHHNLWAHHLCRLPQPGNPTDHLTDPEGLTLDFHNNVVYNWGGDVASRGAFLEGVMKHNWTDNYYKPGPNTTYPRVYYENSLWVRGYFHNNWMSEVNPPDPYSAQLIGYENRFTAANKEAFKLAEPPYIKEPIIIEEAPAAYAAVLAGVGATKPMRDSADTRIINDVINGTGRVIDDEDDVGGWPVLSSGTPPVDTDHDGMPDSWETARGLNPNDALDGKLDRDGDGYTNVEEYINSL